MEHLRPVRQESPHRQWSSQSSSYSCYPGCWCRRRQPLPVNYWRTERVPAGKTSIQISCSSLYPPLLRVSIREIETLLEHLAVLTGPVLLNERVRTYKTLVAGTSRTCHPTQNLRHSETDLKCHTCNYVSIVTHWKIYEPNLIEVQRLARKCRTTCSVARPSQPPPVVKKLIFAF